MCNAEKERIEEAKNQKSYVDSQFKKLVLHGTFKCTVQVVGAVGGKTNYIAISNETVKDIQKLIAGDRVIGHDPSKQITKFWDIYDVLGMRPHLTPEQARMVLTKVDENHDATIGINWDVLQHWSDHLFPVKD